MRAPYDNTCDLYYGLSGLLPYTRYASGPCRFVKERFAVASFEPFSERVAYVTMDFAVPNVPRVTPAGLVLSTDYTYADLLAVPSGSMPAYQVILVEDVAYYGESVYVRVHVRPFNPFPWTPVNRLKGRFLEEDSYEDEGIHRQRSIAALLWRPPGFYLFRRRKPSDDEPTQEDRFHNQGGPQLHR